MNQPLVLLALLALFTGSPAEAARSLDHSLDPATEIIGEVHYEHARRSDTLMDIARWLNMGYREIRLANPGIDHWNPGEGTRVRIPAMHILPEGPRDGIVVNRAEKRLYYYFADSASGEPRVRSHPIGIGREGRDTPVGSARVVRKLERPAWYPTDGVRADYASRGIALERVIPPGPDNPLGEHVLVLDLAGYLLHGTNRPDGVGMRVSQGCVRLYPEHIRELVETVPLGTPVHFVDQPIKLGQRDGRLFLEVHPDTHGNGPEPDVVLAMVERWLASNQQRLDEPVDPARVREIALKADGIPAAVTTSKAVTAAGR